MKHLFTPIGEQALAGILAQQPLLAFDFDGTLAPIVPRPEDARVSAAVAHQLRQLASLRPVAIVTGRTVADVTPRLGFEPHYVIGNHGAEGPWWEPGQPQQESHKSDESGDLLDLSSLDSALEPLRERLAQQWQTLSQAGVVVEDKIYSMALHYRLARHRETAIACIESVLQGMPSPLKIFGGKCVVNIMAANAPDKGDAIVRLIERTGVQAAVFVGDDLNDEAAFARATAQWLTVRIGRDDPRSRAHYFLDSHAEVALFLRNMLKQLQAQLGAA
jgi:trehalose 6-phosphate phosphatase